MAIRGAFFVEHIIGLLHGFTGLGIGIKHNFRRITTLYTYGVHGFHEDFGLFGISQAVSRIDDEEVHAGIGQSWILRRCTQ